MDELLALQEGQAETSAIHGFQEGDQIDDNRLVVDPPLPVAILRDHPMPERKVTGWLTKCPRCGLQSTIATSTRELVQHRICRSPICRYRFKIVTKNLFYS